jgi:hypothetical protein
MKIAYLIPLLSALVLLGCEKKIESRNPAADQSPPIELEVIPTALANEFSQLIGDRFIRIGKVSFDPESNVYHAELFYKQENTQAENRYVLEFTPGNREHQVNLISYRVEIPPAILGETNRNSANRYLYIDEMLNQSKNDHQAGTGQPATRPEPDSQGGDKHQPEAEAPR